MRNRIVRALRVLRGRPVIGVPIDELTTMPEGSESEYDHSKEPPFALAFDGDVPPGPPRKIFRMDRFRVCAFTAQVPCPCCDGPVYWLVLEFRDQRDRWHHLVTMHESRLDIMRSVLDDVAAALLGDRDTLRSAKALPSGGHGVEPSVSA